MINLCSCQLPVQAVYLGHHVICSLFMKRSVTLSDIAKELDIDISTVSKALKNHPKISGETKARVKEAARKLNYFPNSIATALVKGQSNLIGVMVPHTDETFFASAIRGIDEVARVKGYRIIIFQSYDNVEDEASSIETMFRTKVDGIIASHAIKTSDFTHYQAVLDRGIPLVLFDRYTDEIDSDVVAVDDFKGAYKAVTHLIEQGCTSIAHISGFQSVHIFKERVRGYQKALADHGITYNEDLVFESDLSIENGRKITEQLISKGTLPEAIFCSSDRTALGAVQVLREHGIKIPEQVAIAGFSNEEFTSYITPSISSVEQHSREIGKIAAQHILTQIADSASETVKKLSQKTILPPELIIRESSQKK